MIRSSSWLAGIRANAVVIAVALGGLGATLASGCSSNDTTKVGLAGSCKLDSDCDGALVCSFGLCHVGCVTSKDCSGARCIVSAAGNVCEQPSETNCIRNSDCRSPLTCATNSECLTPCKTAVDCVEGQVCAIGGVCADKDEVDAAGMLIGKDGIAAGAGGAGGLSLDAGPKGAGGSSQCVGKCSGVPGAGGSQGAGGSPGAGGASGSGGVPASPCFIDGVPGAVLCAGACINPSTDPANCGTCGNTCSQTGGCVDGKCAATYCGAGFTNCGSECDDLTTNALHCGSCHKACAADEQCSGSTCVKVCDPSTALSYCPSVENSSDGCFDLSTNFTNCGKCGNSCANLERGAANKLLACVGGSCVCLGGLTACGTTTAVTCVDVTDDPLNCGKCGKICPGSEVCSGGQCVVSCTPPLTNCNGACTDTSIDSLHCGSCTATCNGGLGGLTAACSGGHCQASGSLCAGGMTVCLGGGPGGGGLGSVQCADTATDPSNCGKCGTVCAGGPCVGGACTCATAGLTACSKAGCNTACSDLTTDPFNCLRCGNVCPAGEACTPTGCAVAASPCGAGLTQCFNQTLFGTGGAPSNSTCPPLASAPSESGGFCTDLMTDQNNCGSCNAPCSIYGTCAGGACHSNL